MAARRARGGSDLAPRIVVAIPAIVVALFIVNRGGLVFAVGIFLLGVVAMGVALLRIPLGGTELWLEMTRPLFIALT